MLHIRQMNVRRLNDLASVGPATLADFEVLGIRSMEQLARCEAHELYQRLCALTGERHDPCCEDVFRCAIAQARDPFLRAEQRKWWYWTRVRKTRTAAHGY
ncbi:MAG: helix-hairpin-helix domain-containing protein [Bryobacteraceae bacterium]|jgi:hypothetical protein